MDLDCKNKNFDTLSACQEIIKIGNKLKGHNNLKLDKEDRPHGIAHFAYLTFNTHFLKASKNSNLVSAKSFKARIFNGRARRDT
jgi:hypothetical protein